MKNKNEGEEENIKIILLGDCGVGKTNIISRYLNDEFRDEELSTFASYYLKKELVVNGKKLIIDIWDTAGQERYLSITKILVQDANIIILVYSVVEPDSFQHLDIWLNNVIDINKNDFILGICGNKIDLIDEEKVSEKEAQKYANEHNATFKLVSAKEDKFGIDNLFETLITKYINTDTWSSKKVQKIKVKKEKINKDIKKKKCC